MSKLPALKRMTVRFFNHGMRRMYMDFDQALTFAMLIGVAHASNLQNQVADAANNSET